MHVIHEVNDKQKAARLQQMSRKGFPELGGNFKETQEQ